MTYKTLHNNIAVPQYLYNPANFNIPDPILKVLPIDHLKKIHGIFRRIFGAMLYYEIEMAGTG